ncbi:MAG TPA: hypothetical protein EYP39_00360 [Ghiorsea sp.]|nr:hypothetical protein [Ghiorsea sp.]HIP07232.1 hypothetical protein [Mariprofundaceae bacterium]
MFTLLAHGSSHAKHAAQANMLAEKVSQGLDEQVQVSFLSDNALPEGAKVLPLFLGEGKHMQQDVPALMRSSNASILATPADAADSLADLVVSELTQESKRIHVVFVVYQFTGFEKIVAALYKRAKKCSLVAMATLHGKPNVESVLKNLEQQGIKKVVLQPMLLFEGHSLDVCISMTEQTNMDIEIKPALVNIDGMSDWVTQQFKRANSNKVSHEIIG